MATCKTFSKLLFKLISLLSLVQGAKKTIQSLSIENMLKVMFEAGSKCNSTYFSPFSFNMGNWAWGIGHWAWEDRR